MGDYCRPAFRSLRSLAIFRVPATFLKARGLWTSPGSESYRAGVRSGAEGGRREAVGTRAVRFVAWTLASFALFAAGPGFAVDDFRTPAISVTPVEWRTALDQLRAEISASPSVASDFAFATQRHNRPLGPRSMPAFVELN